jgi:hypothetical protein
MKENLDIFLRMDAGFAFCWCVVGVFLFSPIGYIMNYHPEDGILNLIASSLIMVLIGIGLGYRVFKIQKRYINNVLKKP